MLPPLLFLLLWPHWQVQQPLLTFGIGGLLFAAAMVLRVWAQMHLHYRLRAETVLTQTGPYAYVRNPIYLANTVLIVGLCFISKVVWLAPALVVWCAVVYSFVVRHEEAWLSDLYGQPYREYCRQVLRWLPRLRPLPTGTEVDASRYLWPSILSEAHNLLLLATFLLKGALHQHVLGHLY